MTCVTLLINILFFNTLLNIPHLFHQNNYFTNRHIIIYNVNPNIYFYFIKLVFCSSVIVNYKIDMSVPRTLLSLNKFSKTISCNCPRYAAQLSHSITQDIQIKKGQAMLGGGQKRIDAQHKKVSMITYPNISYQYFAYVLMLDCLPTCCMF